MTLMATGLTFQLGSPLEALIRYQLQQGLLEREPALEELFFTKPRARSFSLG